MGKIKLKCSLMGLQLLKKKKSKQQAVEHTASGFILASTISMSIAAMEGFREMGGRGFEVTLTRMCGGLLKGEMMGCDGWQES